MAGEPNPLVPATVMPNYAQQGAIPTYPAPFGTSQGGGTAGLVDKNKIINDGVQNAINQTQQLQKMRRDTQAYKEQQAANKDAAGAANASPTGDGHADFMSSVLQGLHSLGSGVSNIFGGGGIPAPQQGQPLPAQNGISAPPPAAPAPPQMGLGPVLAGTPMAQAIPGQMAGGPVTQPEFMQPQPQPTIVGFQSGGAIPEPGGMGVVTGGVRGISGFEDGGPIPAEQTASAPPAAIAAAPQAPGAAQADMVHQIDELHKDMHAHALGDDDVPNNQRGTPVAPPPAAPAAQGAAPQAPADPKVQAAQASAAAVANTAPSDPAKTGVQTTSPSQEDKPHSIPTDKWQEWDSRIDKAVSSAALAGKDPGQVRQALEANRNAYVQGHVLRYLSSANVAALNGDQKGVQAAMKNAYYYMPDGQELSFQKDKDGNLQYQDPINPTKIDANNNTVPNMVPVDTAHIQMLGTAMLDPMNVQTTINNVRTNAAKIQLEHAQSQAALMTGQGNADKGAGIKMKGQSDLNRDAATNYHSFATGEASLIHANAIANHLKNVAAKMPNQDPAILKGSQDTADLFAKTAAGEYGSQPAMIADTRPGHQGEMTPNDPTVVGKPFRDATKIPVEMKDLNPSQLLEGQAVAGNIRLAQPTMPPAEAVRLAALYAYGKANKPNGTPKGPDGKPMANVHTDPKTGDTHVWNKSMKKWEAFKLPLQTSQDLATTGSILPAGSNGEDGTTNALLAQSPNYGGQGGIPGSPSEVDAAAHEPDMEPQQFPAATG